jgi:hypothetical protein
METFRVILYYFTCRSHYLAGKKSPESISYETLTQVHSYRLHHQAHQDLFIGLRYFKKALQLVWNSADGAALVEKNASAIFDAGAQSESARKSYIKAITHEIPSLFLHKENMAYPHGLGARMVETILLSVFAVWIIPITLFSKKRGSFSLNLLEVIENARLLEHLKKHDIKKVFYFCGFNKDANFAACLLRTNSIYCHKVPSSNPIKNFYQQVVADGFSFTAPYQKQEFEQLKTKWMVRDFKEWPVFHFEQIQPLIPTYSQPESKTLGFISSGIWRRIERGDQALGVGEYESELRLIAFLKEFLAENAAIKFYVFLHPIEKKTPELQQKAEDYYRTQISPSAAFFPAEIPSYKLFDKVDVSIAAYSSTNLERLYAGFKTLYAPLGIRSDYYADSALNNIAAFDESALRSLLKLSSQKSDNEFFTSNQLEAYHHNYYRSLF